MSNPWTLLLLAISAEVIGTSCLRLSEGMTRPLPTLLVFSAYALATYTRAPSWHLMTP